MTARRAEYFQHRNIEELYLNPLSWYAEQDPSRFQFHVGEAVSWCVDTRGLLADRTSSQVVSIDSKRKQVHTSKDNTFSYALPAAIRWTLHRLTTAATDTTFWSLRRVPGQDCRRMSRPNAPRRLEVRSSLDGVHIC